ncbi:hypothetical protein C7H19_22200 [Aphanothece hegewaldii CCALA 016]|uniref:Uncharacterized protein n=1 Tax=Aphanothece hegewaldii CCALA 016 TaxID=2107694 RepID=A0A2T1LS02_9CHRO|nr:hypothetical protein C7H19_22200 [Aphanothece hegewaldii CCALA 016]
MASRFRQDVDQIEQFLSWAITGVSSFLSITLLFFETEEGLIFSALLATVAIVICPRIQLSQWIKLAVVLIVYVGIFL